MRTILTTVILLAIIGIFVADGVSMWGAHSQAVAFSDKAAQQAAQTYVDTGGNTDAVHRVVQGLASGQNVELVDLSLHKGTTRWYTVTVKVQRNSILLGRLPYFKDHVAQQSTAVEHF